MESPFPRRGRRRRDFGPGPLVDEASWVDEVSLWRPDEDDRSRIVRTGRVQYAEEGLP